MTASRFGERVLRDIGEKIEGLKFDAQECAEESVIDIETWEYGDGQSIRYDDLISMIAGLESARNLIDVNMGKAHHRGIDDAVIRIEARRDLIAEMVAESGDIRLYDDDYVRWSLADWLRSFDATEGIER